MALSPRHPATTDSPDRRPDPTENLWHIIACSNYGSNDTASKHGIFQPQAIAKFLAMPLADGIPSTPPGTGASLEESLKYYKAQYEFLESELADFQNSSKELEAELEKDIEASEKREQKLRDKATNLQYEVDEWKTKHKQAKSEAASAQNALQKEITELRDTNRTLQLRLRDIEVANDDFERKQRNTESSLEDIESKYNQTIERGVMLEEEMKMAEQERESLRIEAQRLKDELSDLKIETDIVKDKLYKAERSLMRRSNTLSIEPAAASASPRSELSPTTTDASFDTPPAKTSSSGVSDTPTPPSPPVSERSAPYTKPSLATPSVPKSRVSLNGNIPTPRQSTYNSRPATVTHAHKRGPSIPAISRTGPTSTYRQSFTNNHTRSAPVRGNLPQSQSILHLRNLRSKMQNLEARVQTARSKLPAPSSTPPRASPRLGSAKGNHASATPTPLSITTTIPSSVTVRSKKRNAGSTISGASTLPEPDLDNTDTIPPSAVPRSKPSRQSLTSQYQYTHAPRPPPSPTRPHSQAGPPLTSNNDMPAPAPPSRPDSRASRTSNIYSHSRPGSRASMSGFPRPSSSYGNYALNASTNAVRPKSSLSNHGYDGAFDDEESILEGDESIMEDHEPSFIRPSSSAGPHGDLKDLATPIARRTTFSKRTSDVGSAIPTPKSHMKRESISRASISSTNRFAGPGLGSTRRQSQQGFVFADAPTSTSATTYTTVTPALARRQSQQSFSVGGVVNDGMMRPPSRAMSPRKRESINKVDADETF